MAALNLASTMDALAAKLVASSVAAKRVYAQPEESVAPPCVVIGYPDDIEYDQTFGRGSDRAEFPVWFLVGKVTGKASRDALSAVITGAASVKDVLDGALTVGANVATVRVTGAKPESIKFGDVEYLSARFDCEVVT